MAFDPDKYLAQKSGGGFDPDKYLTEKLGDEQETMLDRIGDTFKGSPVLNKKLERDKAAQTPDDSSARAKTTIDSLADTSLFGYLPQARAAAEKPIFGLLNAATGQDVQPDKYVESRDQAIQELAAEKEKYPTEARTGTAMGIAATMKLPMAMPFKNATGVGVKGLLQRMGQGAAAGAQYGAVSNPGDVQGEVAPVQLGERIGKAYEGARSGALISGGLNLGAKGVESLPTIGKKAMATFLGPNEQHIDYYLKNPEAVNGAKSIEELKGTVDDIVGGLRGKVDSGKMKVDEAKAALKEIESKIRDHRKDSSFQFQVTKTEVNQAFRDAKAQLEKAANESSQKLKDVKAPLSLAPDVDQSLRDLKGKIVEGSQDARNSLYGSGKIELKDSLNLLKNAREGLNISGQAPVTGPAKAAAKEIDGLIESVSGLPEKITLNEAKNLIQQLDRSEKAAYNSPGFTDDVGRTFKELRRNLDQHLKTASPEYAEKMLPVAEMTKLHSEALPKFEGGGVSTLNRIGSNTSEEERQLLSRLGKATGRDFETPIQEYTKAQGILKDPRAMAQRYEELPEQAAVKEYGSAMRGFEGPEAQKEFIEKNLKGSGLLEKQTGAQGLLEQNQRGLLEAEEGLMPVGKLNQNNSEQTLKTVMNARPGERIEQRELLDRLTKMSDTDFVKALEDLKVKNSFNGSRINGSRNVNLFGALGAGVGLMTGGLMHGAELGSMGVVMGGVVDHYGPKIAKQILDGAIMLGKNPNVQRIQALSIDPKAKEYLTKSLIRYQQEH